MSTMSQTAAQQMPFEVTFINFTYTYFLITSYSIRLWSSSRTKNVPTGWEGIQIQYLWREWTTLNPFRNSRRYLYKSKKHLVSRPWKVGTCFNRTQQFGSSAPMSSTLSEQTEIGWGSMEGWLKLPGVIRKENYTTVIRPKYSNISNLHRHHHHHEIDHSIWVDDEPLTTQGSSWRNAYTHL